MKESSDLTKLARWMIPGWIAYLAFYSFVSVDIVFSPLGQKRIFSNIVDFLNSMTDINALITIILVAAAGVPLGFIIYQIYFYLRWNSPFSRDGLLPPFITGRMNDLKRITRDIIFKYSGDTDKWRENWVSHTLFRRDHGYQWRYIELLFFEASQQMDKGKEGASIYERHRYLHEVTHTLGASIGAIYIGFLGYSFLKFHYGLIDISQNALVIIILVSILFYLLNREDKARELLEEQYDLSESTNDEPIPAYDFDIRILGKDNWKIGFSIISPGSQYLFALTSIHLMSNPIFYPEANLIDVVIRSILIILAIIIWVISKKKTYYRIRHGDILILGISFLIALIVRLVPEQFFSWIDWPLFTNILIFLFANLVLFKNRRNACDDMFALEYYTIRQYLSEKSSV